MTMNEEVLASFNEDLKDELERILDYLLSGSKDQVLVANAARLFSYVEILVTMIESVQNAESAGERERLATMSMNILTRVNHLREQLADAGLSTELH